MKLFLFSFSLFLTAAWPATSQELRLLDCYQKALQQSERSAILTAEWQAAAARYQAARDSWLPDLHLKANQTLEPERSSAPSSGDSRELLLTASQPIFTGFRSTRTAQAGAAEARAIELDAKRFRELLYQDVADTFYDLLWQQKDTELLATQRKTLQDRIAELHRRIQLGRSRQNELLAAQTDLAELTVDEEQVRGRYAAARELLLFLIGGSPTQQLILIENTAWTNTPLLETLLTNSAQRADIQAGSARSEKSDLELAAEKSTRLPQIQAQGTLFLDENPDEDHSWTVLLSLELPLFDDGLTSARIREKQHRASISRLDLTRLQRESVRDVRAAWITFSSTMAQWIALQSAEKVADQNYQALRRDFELGRTANLDVLNALSRLLSLRRRSNAAEMLARAYLVRLHVTAGSPTP